MDEWTKRQRRIAEQIAEHYAADDPASPRNMPVQDDTTTHLW